MTEACRARQESLLHLRLRALPACPPQPSSEPGDSVRFAHGHTFVTELCGFSLACPRSALRRLAQSDPEDALAGTAQRGLSVFWTWSGTDCGLWWSCLQLSSLLNNLNQQCVFRASSRIRAALEADVGRWPLGAFRCSCAPLNSLMCWCKDIDSQRKLLFPHINLIPNGRLRFLKYFIISEHCWVSREDTSWAFPRGLGIGLAGLSWAVMHGA